MIKHIFTDMDGTLLNEHGLLSSENKQAIIESKIPLTLVSARPPMAQANVINQLNLKTEQVAFNGALVYKPNSPKNLIISSHKISDNDKKTILDFLIKDYPNISISVYTAGTWYTLHEDHGIKSEEKVTQVKASVVSEEQLYNIADVFKIMLVGLDDEFKDVFQKVKSLDLPNLSIVQSNANYLEITNKQATKQSGIETILELNNLSKENTISFGDGENDLPMFTATGTPIAMDNANDLVKSKAKYITKSNVDNGIAYALKNIVPKI